jgi:hypothetical protein
VAMLYIETSSWFCKILCLLHCLCKICPDVENFDSFPVERKDTCGSQAMCCSLHYGLHASIMIIWLWDCILTFSNRYRHSCPQTFIFLCFTLGRSTKNPNSVLSNQSLITHAIQGALRSTEIK